MDETGGVGLEVGHGLTHVSSMRLRVAVRRAPPALRAILGDVRDENPHIAPQSTAWCTKRTMSPRFDEVSHQRANFMPQAVPATKFITKGLTSSMRLRRAPPALRASRRGWNSLYESHPLEAPAAASRGSPRAASGTWSTKWALSSIRGRCVPDYRIHLFESGGHLLNEPAACLRDRNHVSL